MSSPNFINGNYCIDYKEDVIKYFLAREKTIQSRFKCPHPSLLDKRTILARYLMKIGESINLSLSTLHVAVYILDIVINNNILDCQYNLKHIMLACISLASKLEETEFSFASMYILFEKFDVTDVKKFAFLEMKVFEKANFDISIPTAATFLDVLMPSAAENQDAEISRYNCLEELLLEIRHLAENVLNTALKAFHYNDFLPSIIAASAIMTARHQVGLPYWTHSLNRLTTYNMNTLWPCFSIFAEFKQTKKKNNQGMKRKMDEAVDSGYSSEVDTSPNNHKRKI